MRVCERRCGLLICSSTHGIRVLSLTDSAFSGLLTDTHCYRLQSLGQGNISEARVKNSVHGGGGSASVHAGIPPSSPGPGTPL